MARNYWLVKQEPESYSWDMFVKDGVTSWTGVRNFQARNNLRKMKNGDLVFYYHSVSEKKVVGIAKVTREHYPDPTAEEGDWSAVDLEPLKPLKNPVELATMKTDPILKTLPLIKATRLSTMPITPTQAERVLQLGATKL